MNLDQKLDTIHAFAKTSQSSMSFQGIEISYDKHYTKDGWTLCWAAGVRIRPKSTVYMDNSHILQATGNSLEEVVESIYQQVLEKTREK